MPDTATHTRTEQCFDGTDVWFSIAMTDYDGNEMRPFLLYVHVPPEGKVDLRAAQATAIKMAQERYGAPAKAEAIERLTERRVEDKVELERLGVTVEAEVTR